MRTLPDDQIRTYTDVVYTSITPEARVDLKEAFILLDYDEPSLLKDIFDDASKQGEARGRALGEAVGKAESVLHVLHARGVAVPNDARERIAECRDSAILGTWLARAGIANRIEDVLDPRES